MIQDPMPDPETSLIQKERAENMQETLRALPLATRNILVLREYGELSYQEIASVLDIPIGTVMSRLNYARTRLRALLKEQPSMQDAYA